jgi:hypothetical protein
MLCCLYSERSVWTGLELLPGASNSDQPSQNSRQSDAVSRVYAAAAAAAFVVVIVSLTNYGYTKLLGAGIA